MSSRNKADINMQPVPLSAVKDNPTEENPESEMLPSDPTSNMDQLARETGQKMDASKEEGIPPPIIGNERSTVEIIVEAILFPLLMVIPAWIMSGCFDYETYSFSAVKGPSGLNMFREFERWTYFLAVCYFVWTVSELAFRYAPGIILRVCKMLHIKLSRHERTAILCLRYAEEYLGIAFSLLFIFNYAEFVLYESSTKTAARQIVSRLTWKERIKAYELMLGDRIESAIAALFVLAVVVAAEKYLVAAIHASFHRVALAPRIAKCNEKFAILSVLSRARQSNRATLSTASLAGTDAAELTDDKGVDLSSSARARASAKAIFKTLCPADRDYLTPADFRPYFPLAEYEKSFQVFDSNRKNQLDRHDFKSAVVSIYDERFRTAKTLIANNRIVKKLDWVLLTIFLFFGILIAFVVFNHNGYSWVSSLGSFILGFSFLFQTTMSRVFDTFLFVFVEHAYDVSDNVLVDNEHLLVSEIEIFTTIFTRNDGLLVYSPNSSLKGKSIYNRQRTRSEMDEIIFLVDARTDIAKLAKLRTQLTGHLTETVNEFTGTVSVNILRFEGEGSARQACIKVEPKYRPKDDDLRSDLTLHNRRADLMDRFNSVCSDLSIRTNVVSA
jgi:small-conductance mechanosensitive channel